MMGRIFLGGVFVFLIVALRLIFVSDPLLGALMTYGAVGVFFVFLVRTILSQPGVEEFMKDAPPSDPNGPDQGWDHEIVESARRRADGIE